MFNSLLSRPVLLNRIKSIYGCAVLAAVALGGYMAFTGAARFSQAVLVERAVDARKAESVLLLAQVKHALSPGTGLPKRGSAGVEAFAVQMAAWASAHNVSVESLSPEGVEGTQAVDFENTTLGQWATNKVSVRVGGQFDQVMNVLGELCTYTAPVRLESFSLQSVDGGATGVVEFQIMVTVYRRKSGAT